MWHTLPGTGSSCLIYRSHVFRYNPVNQDRESRDNRTKALQLANMREALKVPERLSQSFLGNGRTGPTFVLFCLFLYVGCRPLNQSTGIKGLPIKRIYDLPAQIFENFLI